MTLCQLIDFSGNNKISLISLYYSTNMPFLLHDNLFRLQAMFLHPPQRPVPLRLGITAVSNPIANTIVLIQSPCGRRFDRPVGRRECAFFLPTYLCIRCISIQYTCYIVYNIHDK